MESPEYSLTILLAAAAGALLLGLLAGLLLGRRASPGNQKYREVERKLDQVLGQKAYEDDVVEHFSDVRHPHRGARMPRIGPLHRIHGQHSDCVSQRFT